ncbi:CapA family protein [Phocaeicola sp.]|uniref:CapA family protein n=1 Tax=Phocaeicola sp. TaxID=2773926 RepID=UPI0023BFB20B|nr:CapA family protein [Phocaeicola sp.]MDE5677288.1 CapA family protein [Phocaeicola sp.]
MKPIVTLCLLWLCLSSSAQDHISLLFVGDLMQHQAQIDAARQGDGYCYDDCFRHVRAEISKADIAVGNLEVTLGGAPYHGYPVFSAPDEYLFAIKEAGFDVLLTANNHCLDKRKTGLERTIRMLDSLNISHVGTYRNKEERHANYPLLIDKNGFRIALLNYTYGTNGIKPDAPNVVNYIDKEQIKEDILDARRKFPDVIIACMHWGVEYRSFPERSERDLADWLISQGVDHVIGSHPHVLQPMEIKKNPRTPARHVVVYSLGNFISNMSKEKTDGGAMVRLDLQRVFRITRLVDCEYALIWTSRPILSGKKNFELYPAHFIDKLVHNEESKPMNRFLKGARELLEKSNKGIKEYFFE